MIPKASANCTPRTLPGRIHFWEAIRVCRGREAPLFDELLMWDNHSRVGVSGDLLLQGASQENIHQLWLIFNKAYLYM